MEILIGKGTYRDKFYMLNPFKQREVEKWREKVNKYDIIRQNKKDVFRAAGKVFN